MFAVSGAVVLLHAVMLEQECSSVSIATMAETSGTASFRVPEIVDCDRWGPPGVEGEEVGVPYAPFNKSERLGRAADWTASARYPRYYQGQSGVNTAFNFFHHEDDENFTLVDTTSRPKTNRFPGRRTHNQRNSRKNNKGKRDQNKKPGQKGQHQSRFGRRWRNWSNRRYQPYGDPKRDFAASIEVRPSWELMDELDIGELAANSFNAPEPEDLVTCGELEHYDKTYDHLDAKVEKPLERLERTFFNVTTSDDPVIRDLGAAGKANVFATDRILSLIMASPRSVYSWDLVVTRVGANTLIFDKRENSQIDFLTVNETAMEPPHDDKDPVNSPDNLSKEATFINQNFSQQVLHKGEDRYSFDRPNPFATDETEEAAPVGYRYRKWRLGEHVSVVARCELEGMKPNSSRGRGQGKFMLLKALNEYDLKTTGWRQKLDSQRGAVLATELKNNSAKLARWTLQALMAGADSLLLGYVSRVNPKDPYNHVVLATQAYKPGEFAKQINLNEASAWGILRAVVERCLEMDPGKYLLMKVPNKAQLNLYKVPQDAFDEGDEEDDEDDDMQQNEDDDE